MEVTVNWTETVSYTSTIKIDEEDLLSWLNDGVADESEKTELANVTAEQVKDYLEAGEESEWFEQTNTDTDFQAAQDRDIDDVQL